MINLVINNNTVYEMEDKLLMILVSRFTQNRDVWHQFQMSWWPENRKSTMERLERLQSGDNIICAHTFVDYGQFEIMASLLKKFQEKNIKINIYIYNVDLQARVDEYFQEDESELTPDTEEYNDSWHKRLEFKKGMNELVREQLQYHNLYQLSWSEDRDVNIMVE